MRCSAYEGCQVREGRRPVFFGAFGRVARRNGATAEWSPARSGEALLTRRTVFPATDVGPFSLSKSFGLSPLSPRGSSSGGSRQAARSVSPRGNVFGQGAMHQLLSGQLGPGPTPIVSYLDDGGDRGLRPF